MRAVKKCFAAILLFVLSVSLVSCAGQRSDLIDMRSTIVNDSRSVVWEGRTYVPFCVVSKNDRGRQIGYVDGDTNDRISEYRGYPPEEWLVSWLPTDGGAMLLKEQSVTDIPDGLEAEY